MDKITHAYMDLDSIAYVGASIAEKPVYQWVHKDGEQKSKKFSKAKDAKLWYESKVGFDEIDPDDWTREKVIDLKPVDVAIKGVEYELQSWIRTAKKLTNNPDIKLKGWLTSSGWKTKDIEGLQDRYQFNRYDCLKEWIPKPKPTHLKECREYLLRTYDWIKLSPKNIEADAPVVYFSEKRGLKAVCMSKDKDLKQAMNTNFIDMNDSEKSRVLFQTTELGYIDLRVMAQGKEDITGHGFKLLCYQTCVGDQSDGYKGLKGFGVKAGYNLLKDLKSVDECCKAMVDLYSTKYPDGIEYKCWKGKKVKRTWKELLIQHCQLAYHERSGKDKSNPMSRYLNGEDPLFRHN